MKIAVIGAGAMGNLFGAYLSEKNEVYMIDVNKSAIDSINKNGLRIFEKDVGKSMTYLVPAVCDSSQLGEMDLVIIFVKNLYTVTAIENNKHLIGDETLVISLQNGAGNDKDLAMFVKKENIVIGTTEHNCCNLGKGQISHDATGITNLGMINFDEDKISTLADVFRESNIETAIYNNIQEIIWKKLFINMSLNSITAVLQCKVGYLCDNKYAATMVENIISEAVDVANADGMHFNKEEVIKKINRSIRKDYYDIFTSMNQDIAKKRKTEIDHINGAVVHLAKAKGIRTPYNECIVNLVHAMEGLF